MEANTIIHGDLKTRKVTVGGKEIHPKVEESQGFRWGYLTVGTAQLAFAILEECTPSNAIAAELFISFAYDVLGKVDDTTDLNLTGKQVIDWLSTQSIAKASPKIKLTSP